MDTNILNKSLILSVVTQLQISKIYKKMKKKLGNFLHLIVSVINCDIKTTATYYSKKIACWESPSFSIAL